MSKYIKINSDNSVKFLGNQLFNSVLEDQIFYTGNIPSGDFFIWDETSSTILEDFETRRKKELSNIRAARDQLLQDTDWMIIKSLESGDIDPEWIEYRQELRDLPSQYSLTGLIDFPDPPTSGLHDSINVRDLQPYTIKIIESNSGDSKIHEEDWGDWQKEDWGNWQKEEGEEEEIFTILSGSGRMPIDHNIDIDQVDPSIFIKTSDKPAPKSKYDYIPSGISGDMLPKFLKQSFWNDQLKAWLPKL